MPNKENVAAVKEIKVLFEGATAIFVSHNNKLTVEEATELRAKLRAVGAKHKVLKNTLAAIVAREDNFDIADLLTGPTQVTICKGDFIGAAKALVEFAKGHEHFVVLGGMVEGKKASKADVEAIATLPSREVLLAKLAGSLQSPITGFVRVLSGPQRGLVIALNAVAEKKAA